MHGVRVLSALVVDGKRVKAAKKNDTNYVAIKNYMITVTEVI